MSASVFWTDLPLAAGDTVRLDGPEGRHAATVMRLRAGEAIELVDGRGTRAVGLILATHRDAMDVRVEAVVLESPPTLAVTVVQALLKGEHGELAIDQLTQIGVDRIVPWASQHAVVSTDRQAKLLARLRQRVIAAGKQARLARFPELADVASTDDVAALVTATDVAVVLHEAAGAPLEQIALPTSGTVLLVVGPEGGLSDAERALLAQAGAHEALLGPSVLRGSLAGAVAAGIVLSRTRWAAAGSGRVAGSSS